MIARPVVQMKATTVMKASGKNNIREEKPSNPWLFNMMGPAPPVKKDWVRVKSKPLNY